MKNAPVQVTRAGDQVSIKAYINFTGDINAVPDEYSVPLAKLFATGIKERWGGIKTPTQYDDFGNYNSINVKVDIYAKQATNDGSWIQHASEGQKYYEVKLVNNQGSTNKDHVPHMNTRFFGLANWTYKNPGKITMYVRDGRNDDDYTEDNFKATSAHEFGHILGLGDAYKTDEHKAAPVTIEVPDGNFGAPESSIMRRNGIAKANDVEMVLEAFRTNRWQEYVDYGRVKKSTVIKSY